jgi:non-ribosomal peptide synthetase component F
MSQSYAHGASEVPLLGETIGANLERTALRVPDRLAIVSRHQDVRLTYRELDHEVDRVARALMAAGLQVGDRLGIWSPNCVEFPRLLPRQDRPLQGAPLRPGHRGVPDDDHRQGPEVQAAGDGG